MCRKYFFTLLFIAAIAEITFGQAAKSPFSSFGVGEVLSPALVNSQGMGGVGISNPQYYYLNNQNPALLVFNSYTTLSAGFLGEKRTIRNNSISEKNSSGNLSYLTMGFPVMARSPKAYTNRWSSSFGLMPYSIVNYKLNYTSSLEGTSGVLNVTETGSGGINQAVWSNGITINRYLSVGVRARYLFGAKIEQFSNYLAQAPVYQPNIYQRQRYSDINFTGGLSFHKDSLTSKNLKLNVGMTYEMQSNVKTTYFSRLERLSANNIVDSVTIVNNRVGNTVLPPSIGGGLSIGRRGWIVATDIIYTDYRRYKDYFGASAGTQSAMHYAVGAEFTSFSSVGTNYFGKMTYRVGAAYDDYPFLINGQPAKDVGINLGIALPVAGISSLDIAVKFGKRGDLNTNSLTENYFKIYFGAAFSDRWFIKRKFD